jgi:hypothetical protein
LRGEVRSCIGWQLIPWWVFGGTSSTLSTLLGFVLMGHLTITMKHQYKEQWGIVLDQWMLNLKRVDDMMLGQIVLMYGLT